MKNLLVQAIKNLKPDSEFVITNDDYATIEWHKLDGTAPSKAEVDAEIAKVKAEIVKEAEEKETKRAALLTRLGLTEDEARLLLS